MSGAANKQIVLEFWEAAMTGDAPKIASLLADDVKVLTIGDMPVCGLMSKDQFLRTMAKVGGSFEGGGLMRIGDITAEDDRVAIEIESFFTTKTGRPFNNQYHLLFYLRDDRIVGIKEYCDTLQVFDVLEGGHITGPRIPRVSNIWNLTKTVQGDPGTD
jgi:hypothetical protein